MLRHYWDELHVKYEVKNLITSSSSYIFILESPHVEEIKFGVPVAGASGRMMTKVLLHDESKEPFGKIISTAIFSNFKDASPFIKSVGIMNICRIPLQAAAYGQDTQCKHRGFLTLLEQIRTRPDTHNYKIPELKYVREIICNDFATQLQNLPTGHKIFIPCGKFAQSFFYRTSSIIKGDWDMIEGVPHPSRNQWFNPKFNAIEELRRLVDRANERTENTHT
jgi:hypothetical protein